MEIELTLEEVVFIGGLLEYARGGGSLQLGVVSKFRQFRDIYSNRNRIFSLNHEWEGLIFNGSEFRERTEAVRRNLHPTEESEQATDRESTSVQPRVYEPGRVSFTFSPPTGTTSGDTYLESYNGQDFSFSIDDAER